MLSYDELLGQVKQLSAEERLALIEATAQMVKEDLRHHNSNGKPAVINSEVSANNDEVNKYTPFIREEWLHLNEETLKAQGIELRGTPVGNFLGIARSNENGVLPTDKAIKEDYINYLTEKYS